MRCRRRALVAGNLSRRREVVVQMRRRTTVLSISATVGREYNFETSSGRDDWHTDDRGVMTAE